MVEPSQVGVGTRRPRRLSSPAVARTRGVAEHRSEPATRILDLALVQPSDAKRQYGAPVYDSVVDASTPTAVESVVDGASAMRSHGWLAKVAGRIVSSAARVLCTSKSTKR